MTSAGAPNPHQAHDGPEFVGRSGIGILEIESVTMDGPRLKHPEVSLSGSCDRLLIGHLGDRHSSGDRVLDLGCGTGPNGLYFARNGCVVEMVDASEEAIRICRDNAQQLGFSVSTEIADVRQLQLEVSAYDLIILSYVLQFMSLAQARQLTANCVAALKPGGSLYLSTFSTAGELFMRLSAEALEDSRKIRRIEERTFQFESGRVLSFQTAEEVLANCEALTCKHFFEGRELDVSHGEPHYHSFLAYIGTKEG